MTTQQFSKKKCSKCKGHEEVPKGTKPKVSWHKIKFDGWADFQFCPKCVAETFGEKYVETDTVVICSRDLKFEKEPRLGQVFEVNGKKDPANPGQPDMEYLSREMEKVTSDLKMDGAAK